MQSFNFTELILMILFYQKYAHRDPEKTGTFISIDKEPLVVNNINILGNSEHS